MPEPERTTAPRSAVADSPGPRQGKPERGRIGLLMTAGRAMGTTHGWGQMRGCKRPMGGRSITFSSPARDAANWTAACCPKRSAYRANEKQCACYEELSQANHRGDDQEHAGGDLQRPNSEPTGSGGVAGQRLLTAGTDRLADVVIGRRHPRFDWMPRGKRILEICVLPDSIRFNGCHRNSSPHANEIPARGPIRRCQVDFETF